jgi:RNA polymerase sigma-32 factor
MAKNLFSLAFDHPAALSRERETELARRWRDTHDVVARDLLVRAHLRSVVAIARRYRNRGATAEELVAEGNFGLVQALAKFDPERGIRFVTYAAYWIRACIVVYLRRSRSVVNTGIQSKLLGRLRRERAKLAAIGLRSGDHADAHLAKELGVPIERIRDLLQRLELSDLSLNARVADGSDRLLFEAQLPHIMSDEARALSAEFGSRVQEEVLQAVTNLDRRERYIVEQRLMADPEDQLSLAEIGRRLGVSRERARQLELRAKRKVRKSLERGALRGESIEWRAA